MPCVARQKGRISVVFGGYTPRRGDDSIRARKRNDETWIQTGYAEIVRLAKRRSLRLELCLDNVERTGRDTRDKATACASCEGGYAHW